MRKTFGLAERVELFEQFKHRARAQLERRVREQMQAAHEFGQRGVVGRHAQSRRQRAQWDDAGVLVAMMTRQLLGRRERLAQIVRERAPADQRVAGS